MIKKAILILISIYVLVLLGFYLFQKKLIFQSKKLEKGFTYTFDKNFEELQLKMADAAMLNAIHFKVKNSKGVILYFHGNKGNLERWGPMVSPLTLYGYDVFVVDYRGYGKSTGQQNEDDMYNDALLTYKYLNEQYAEDKIIVYGRSLGCTFASFVASKQNPKAVVLEAPFYSLESLVKEKFSLLPYKRLLKFKFNSYTFMDKIKAPMVIFHGTSDTLIPMRFGEKLYEMSNPVTTEFISIEGGTHHNLGTSKVYKEKLKTLLN